MMTYDPFGKGGGGAPGKTVFVGTFHRFRHKFLSGNFRTFYSSRHQWSTNDRLTSDENCERYCYEQFG